MIIMKKILIKLLASVVIFTCIVQKYNANEILNSDIPHILNLEGTSNTRDLGGYVTKNGESTKFHIFLRSDNTNNLTDNDITFLKKYGVKTVIDMRGYKETSKSEDKLSKLDGIKYYNIPIEADNKKMSEFLNGKCDLSDIYLSMMSESQGKTTIKNLFEIIASESEGTILFHCTYGKDRTGILSMLLLGLCGVNEEDIIHDYSITYDLIKDSKQVQKGMKYSYKPMFLSLPEYIKPCIEYIAANYESFDKYLISCGIDEEKLDNIKNRLS